MQVGLGIFLRTTNYNMIFVQNYIGVQSASEKSYAASKVTKLTILLQSMREFENLTIMQGNALVV